jgi:hypothetical protein
MADSNDPYEQAEQELAKEGRLKPKGDAWPKCFIDALKALAVAFPLVLLIGRTERDMQVMWLVIFGVGAMSFAVRYYSERKWWNDYSQRAKMNQIEHLRREQRDSERSKKLSKLLGGNS